jgi:hypothetical protein
MGTVTAAGRDCVLGTDQSRYQPANNVDRYAGCRVFLITKFSGGDGGLYLDGTGPAKNAAARGRVWRGGYHFLGNDNSGEAQADYFVRAAGGYIDFELPVTIDFETYGNRRPGTDKLRGFITELHRLVPRRWVGPLGHPVACNIYSGITMAGLFFPGCEIYDLILAAYLNRAYPNPADGVTNGCSPAVAMLGSPDRYIPWPWRTWGAWQYAGGDGGAPGVGNERDGCDQDVMTTEMFGRMTGGIQPAKDGFDMAELKDLENIVAPLVDKIAALEKRCEGLEQAVAVAGRDARVHPFKIQGDGDWVAFPGVNPLTGTSCMVRAKLRDGDEFLAWTDVGLIDPTHGDFDKRPTSDIDETNPARARWLRSLPIVSLPDPPAA